MWCFLAVKVSLVKVVVIFLEWGTIVKWHGCIRTPQSVLCTSTLDIINESDDDDHDHDDDADDGKGDGGDQQDWKKLGNQLNKEKST